MFLRQSTTITIKIGPFLDDTTGKDAETALTIAQADVRLSKNGGAYAQKTEATSCTHDENGEYGCPLDATDTGTLGRLKLVVFESGALPVWHEYMVIPANVWDSLFSTDKLQVDTVEVSGTAQTANDNGADINAILVDTTGLNGDAMRGTNNAALASVVGALADAAAAGEVTEADTLMKYIKQLINVLIGTPGIGTFPAEAAPANAVSLAEVIRAIHADVTGLNGDAMKGTDNANTTVPDAAGVAPTAGEIKTEIEQVGSSLAQILADTSELQTDDIPGKIATAQSDLDKLTGTDGATLATTQANYAPNKVVPDAAGTAATPVEVATALSDINLDHLMKVAVSNRDTMPEVVDDTVLANIMTKTDGDTSDFDHATDSLEAIKDASSGNITDIMGTALTETTGGRLANNMSTFWDNADAATANVVDNVGGASGGGSNLVLPAGYVGDFKDDDTVAFNWDTIDRSGAAKAPSTAGTIKIYKGAGTTEVQAPTGITDTRAFSGTTGNHQCVIDLSASTSYVKGSNYNVVLEGAVVDTKTVNVTIATFSIEKRYQGVEFEKGE